MDIEIMNKIAAYSLHTYMAMLSIPQFARQERNNKYKLRESLGWAERRIWYKLSKYNKTIIPKYEIIQRGNVLIFKYVVENEPKSWARIILSMMTMGLSDKL